MDTEFNPLTGLPDIVLGDAEIQAIGDARYLKLDQTTPQTITATDVTITASDEVYFGDVTDSTKIKKDTVQGILDLVPAPDLSAYAKLDGTNQPFEDDIGVEGNAGANVYVNAYPVGVADGEGGTKTEYSDGGVDYVVHRFTSSGTFIAPSPATVLDVLVVGGGGGGGNGWANNGGGGGGGAGGYVYDTYSVTAGEEISVVVAESCLANTNGNNSSFGAVTAYGGGKGGTQSAGSDGGSGGGGAGGNVGTPLMGGSAIYSGEDNLGYAGGAGDIRGVARGGGGGGGGSGSAGTTATSYKVFPGGSGTSNSITGSAVTYAAGGSGGGNGSAGAPGANGAANTGNGGGGGGQNGGVAYSGGTGGSGVVIVRYVKPSTATSPAFRLKASGVETARLYTDGNASNAIKINDATGTVVTIEQGTGDTTFVGDLAANNLSGTNTGDQNDHGTLDGLSDDDHPQYRLKTETKTIVVDGDFYGMYRVSSVKKISPPDLGFGYTITNVKVQCASADPTTEFAGDLKWSDAQGNGAFPGANPTVIKVLDTTTGNYDSVAITESVATGKELYIEMDSATDYGVMWTITITYTLKTS